MQKGRCSLLCSPCQTATWGCHIMWTLQGILGWAACSVLGANGTGSPVHVRTHHKQPAPAKTASESTCWVWHHQARSQRELAWIPGDLGSSVATLRERRWGEGKTKIFETLESLDLSYTELSDSTSTCVMWTHGKMKWGCSFTRNVLRGSCLSLSRSLKVSHKDTMRQFEGQLRQTEDIPQTCPVALIVHDGSILLWFI